ncbi:hypothetical protein [Streptomyces sp. NPDC097640]|uniref:hypothetical protein n=1 Tax=Streptomyces sp. NPDC097640 TaxID=3157229 RepID=UPI0033258816
MQFDQSLPKEDQPITGEEYLRIHNIGHPADLIAAVAAAPTDESDDTDHEFEEDEFDHGGCFMPHVRGGEYIDCDGHPL